MKEIKIMIESSVRFVVVILLISASTSVWCFTSHPRTTTPTPALNLFDKIFEEEGPLGKGITVGKVQVALSSPDRGKGSIFSMLEDNARWSEDDNDASTLADIAHDVCLTLLR